MKKTIAIILAILMISALCACGAAQEAQPSAAAETPAGSPAETAAGTAEPASSPAETVTVTLYHGDDMAEHLVAQECTLKELSPEAILAELYKMGVFSEEVACGSFSRSDGSILSLDLSESFGKMAGSTGTAGELMLMGSLVNSFLSAYGADGLNLTVDGSPLETGHNIYDYTLIFYED